MPPFLVGCFFSFLPGGKRSRVAVWYGTEEQKIGVSLFGVSEMPIKAW